MGPQKGRPTDSAFGSNGEAMGQSSPANSVHAVGLPDGGAGDLRPGQRRVEVQLLESFSAIQHRLPVTRYTRWFSNTSPDEILSLILGLKFCGAGGPMADSTACSEECFPDRRARSIKTFRPLGKRLGSALAGSFDVLQELIECFWVRMALWPTSVCRFLQPPQRLKDPPGVSFGKLKRVNQMDARDMEQGMARAHDEGRQETGVPVGAPPPYGKGGSSDCGCTELRRRQFDRCRQLP
jgi:hypothetical protein